MRRFHYLIVCLAISILSIINAPFAHAGGPVSITRTSIAAPAYSAYLSCSCNEGSYTVVFQNEDDVPLTVVGDGWQLGPIQPLTSAGYVFTDPGTFTYHLAEATSQTGTVTILNQSPVFSDTASLLIESIGYTDATVSWPEATDDGPGISYNLYVNDNKVVTTSAHSFFINNLTENTNYRITVEAMDHNGLITKSDRMWATLTTRKHASPEPTVTTAPRKSPTTSIPTSITSPTSPSASPVALLTTGSTLTLDTSTIRIATVPASASKTVAITKDKLTVSGTSTPNTAVTVTVYSTPRSATVIADAAGVWEVSIDLAGLEKGSHTVQAKYEKDGQSSADTVIGSIDYQGPGAQALQSSTSRSRYQTLVGALAVLVIAGAGLGYMVWERRTKNSDPKLAKQQDSKS